MVFRKSREKVDKSVGKMDKIVTGIILWAAVASIFGLWKTKKWQELTGIVYEQSKTGAKKWIWIFWKLLVLFVSIFSKKRK